MNYQCNVLLNIWLNKSMPTIVIYGPMEHGGVKLIATYALQDQIQVVNIMKHPRWEQIDTNDILVTLDNIQLASGFICPVLAKTG